MSSAAIVSLRMRLSGKGEIFRDRRVEMVADHQHIEMLVDRIHREGARRIGRGGNDVGKPRHLHDVRRMTAAGALGMKGRGSCVP